MIARYLGAAAVLMVSATLAACGAHSSGSASGRVIRVTERDFTIRAPHEVQAGRVRFLVTNQGPVSHELILVRTLDGTLPLRNDGFTVNEEALASQTVGALEPAGPGSERELDVRLRPGRYVLFCNMAGHYMSGMSSPLLVQ